MSQAPQKDLVMDEFPVRGDITIDEEIQGLNFLGYSNFLDGAVTVGIWIDPEKELPDNFNIDDILSLPSLIEGGFSDKSLDPDNPDDDDEPEDDFSADWLPSHIQDLFIDDIDLSTVPPENLRGAGYVDPNDAWDYISDGGLEEFAGIAYDDNTGLWYVVITY